MLNGRHYHWKAGFPRHPGCDCTYAIDGRTVEPIDPSSIRGLSQADRWAVDRGADLSAVVNAQRGMYTTEQYGQTSKATRDSTKHRDSAFPSSKIRLRPESILDIAGDSEEAIGLLRDYGYIK